MALAIAIVKPDQRGGNVAKTMRGGVVRRRFSRLTWRILAPNLLALIILIGGLFYIDQYREDLILAKKASLQTQAEIIAGAVGEVALFRHDNILILDANISRLLVRRLAAPSNIRARLFSIDHSLLADSRALIAAGRRVDAVELPPQEGQDWWQLLRSGFSDWLPSRWPANDRYPLYTEHVHQAANDYGEVLAALNGEVGTAVRRTLDDDLHVSVAVPVQQLRRVQAALLVSATAYDIEEAVKRTQLTIFLLSAVALAVTFVLSVFFASTIAGPIRQLALAADRVRHVRFQRVAIPDMRNRSDEIGDLSAALSDMTDTLYARLDAIEGFAADVSHELKNPLSSLRSATETLALTDDPQKQQQLRDIIQQDVARLNRLISDISKASRVDSEIMREAFAEVDLAELLQTTIEIYRQRQYDKPIRFTLDLPTVSLSQPQITIQGLATRLGQVLDNLLANAVSFSPENGEIIVSLRDVVDHVRIEVSDAGPGLPEERTERLFERFYSDRPEDEAFGQHSGLGLSICQQIVAAHDGTIHAENRHAADGRVAGARFIVKLPRSA